MKKKTSKRVIKSKVKSKTKSKSKAKVIVIRTSREERPRMGDSVASGFGAGFGVAAGHEVGDWLFNPGRKGRRRNPESKPGKHVLIPKFESKQGPVLIEISYVEDTAMGKQIVDKLGKSYLVDEYNIQGPYDDVRGLMSPERALKVWRDIYYTKYPYLKR